MAKGPIDNKPAGFTIEQPVSNKSQEGAKPGPAESFDASQFEESPASKNLSASLSHTSLASSAPSSGRVSPAPVQQMARSGMDAETEKVLSSLMFRFSKEKRKDFFAEKLKDAFGLTASEGLSPRDEAMIVDLAASKVHAEAGIRWLVGNSNSETLQNAGISSKNIATLSKIQTRAMAPTEYAKTTLKSLSGTKLSANICNIIERDPYRVNHLLDGLPEMIQSDATANNIGIQVGHIQQELIRDNPDVGRDVSEEIVRLVKVIGQRARLASTQPHLDALGADFVDGYRPQGGTEQRWYDNAKTSERIGMTDVPTGYEKMKWHASDDSALPIYGASWNVESAPTQQRSALMKGQRQLAIADRSIADQTRARFCAVNFDFSDLGELNVAQGRAIMEVVHARAQNGGNSQASIDSQKKQLQQQFNTEQTEMISNKLTDFLGACDLKYEQLHGELFRYRGDKENQSQLVRVVD